MTATELEILRIDRDQLAARVSDLTQVVSDYSEIGIEHAKANAGVLNRSPAASLLLHDADLIDGLSDKYDDANWNDYDWYVTTWLNEQAAELRKKAGAL